MTKKLRSLGSGWRPLLETSVEALVQGGLELGSLWPTPAARAAALARLARLLDQVVTWNARIDLTAARNERELCDLFLVDALVLGAHGASQRRSAAERWVDVGSGAGAPGLVLALLWPGLALDLVEPLGKRVAFLRSAAGSFPEVGKIGITDSRSEVVAAGSYDVALSRATFSPQEWLEEGARLANQQVWVLLARAEPPVLPGWRLARQVDYTWPLTGVPRQALGFERAPAAHA
jgi:16S rRNA (guanine527-N7)-methyltransferase